MGMDYTYQPWRLKNRWKVRHFTFISCLILLTINLYNAPRCLWHCTVAFLSYNSMLILLSNLWGLQNRWNLLQLLKHWLKIILLYSLYIKRSNNTKYGCVYTLLIISTTKLKIFNVYLFQKVEIAAIFIISGEVFFKQIK